MTDVFERGAWNELQRRYGNETATTIWRVERHVWATDMIRLLDQARAERERQEANVRKWAEERKRAEAQRVAAAERQRQSDIAALEAERAADEQRKRELGR